MDGDQCVEGSWRKIFIHNGGTYFLTDLKIYGDGLVDCWGLINLDEFRHKVASGWVAMEVPAGAQVSVHGLAHWTIAEQTSHITGDDLIAEVIDEIEQLAGRPTSSDRCMAALDAFLDSPDEDHRDVLRAAYYAIPEHLRRYVLGDMDAKDFPLRTLMTSAGASLDGRVITSKDHEQALEHFAERRRGASQAEVRSKERRIERRPAVLLPQVMRPNCWPADPGIEALRAEFPRPITYGNRSYPSVHHAFWAAVIMDPSRADELLAGPTPYAVEKSAHEIGLRAEWFDSQLAVMADLLRRRFQNERDLADLLLSTGDSQLLYQAWDDAFWGYGDGGENWMGRLLELVRSEISADPGSTTRTRRWRR